MPLSASPRELLRELTSKRDNLETEADAIRSELESHGPHGEAPMGIKGPLVDPEGYPRADVDVHRARLLRHRLACIQTDHKQIMKQIEELLPQLLKNTSEASTSAPSSSHSADSNERSAPFAKIGNVRSGSPADVAGLRADDEIVSFGDATSLNDVKEYTMSHLNESFAVLVVSRREEKTLHITPQAWSGEGVLGCSFLPLL